MFSPHTSGGLIGGNGGKMAKRSLARFQRGRFEISEIAQHLGITRREVVYEWRKRHTEFPELVATLKTALICDWYDFKGSAESIECFGH